MDRRTLLFVAISVSIIVLYQEFVLKRYAPTPTPVDAPITATDGPAESPSGAAPAAQVAAQAPAVGTDDVAPLLPETVTKPIEGQRIRVETDLYIATFTTVGGRLEDFLLKKYRETNAPDSPPLSLVLPAPEIELPLGIELRGARAWRDSNQVYQADRRSLSLAGSDTGTLTLRTTFDGQPIVKRFTFRGDTYPIDMVVETPPSDVLPPEVTQATPDGKAAAVALLLTRARKKNEDGTTFEGPAALVNDEIVQTAFDDLEGPEVIDGAVEWAGFEDHYFLVAAAPERAVGIRMLPKGNAVEEKILTPRAATGPTNLAFTLYLGPKDRPTLEAAGHGFAKGLQFGWFAPIALILLQVLEYSHGFTGNWGVDIILLTLLVKILFWPLTRKSFASMRDMQKVQPEMARIREKYKDDSQKMNTEVMELYKRHGVNPLGGCLPMVLQIPVFIGLYQLLQNTIQLRHAPFAFWITDLAAPERLQILGYGIPVLTLLLGASMFLQQKLSPQAGDPNQQKIMMFMPVVFTFMFIGFPAGLTIYWLVNNLLTIGQQWWMLRAAPT
ncbi:MAG: membrane protein insertase YidC [Candidatus Binatia bacterium]|nr:membrane protein insertase YidC [Candidatus Binatia bacterium]